MKLQLTHILVFLVLLSCPVLLHGANEDKVIGISVIQEEENPLHYTFPQFEENPLSNYDLSRANSQTAVLNYLNMMSTGKHLLNYLLGYNLGKVDPKILFSRIPEAHRNNPRKEDLVAAILNNYILVIKMDEGSRRKAMLKDTVDFKPTGNWYLYQVAFSDAIYEKVTDALPQEGDDMGTLGSKRIKYEGITLPITLIDQGDNISLKLNELISSNIHYISGDEIMKSGGIEKLGKKNKALKWILSPFLILKQ